MTFNGWQLCRLHGKAHRDVARFPGGFAFLQARVGALAAAPQHRRQRLCLLGRWQQFVLVGFAPYAYTLLYHTQRVCLTGDKPAPGGTVVAMASRRATRLSPPERKPGALSRHR